jgi:hypothetical protein
MTLTLASLTDSNFSRPFIFQASAQHPHQYQSSLTIAPTPRRSKQVPVVRRRAERGVSRSPLSAVQARRRLVTEAPSPARCIHGEYRAPFPLSSATASTVCPRTDQQRSPHNGQSDSQLISTSRDFAMLTLSNGPSRGNQEQRYFEQRAMFGGVAPGMGMFDGYRKCESNSKGWKCLPVWT